MAKRQKTEETLDESVKTESTPLSPVQKVRLMNSLVNVIESKQFKESVLAFDNGNRIYEIFEKAANDEIQRIMNGNGASEEMLTEAQEKVEDIVNTCLRLQEQLITLIKGRKVPANEPVVQQPVAQKVGGRRQPIYEPISQPQAEQDSDVPPYMGY